MNDPSPNHGDSAMADKARDAAGVAGDHATEVMATAREQVRNVAQDARAHVEGVARTAQERVNEQAGVAGERAAEGLRTLANQFGALAAGDPGAAGPFADYAGDIRARADQLAARLEDGPDAVLDDIRRFARQRPLVFLAGVGVAGFIAGRIVMGARDAESEPEQGRLYGAPPVVTPGLGSAAGDPVVGRPSAMVAGTTTTPAVDREGLPLPTDVPS